VRSEPLLLAKGRLEKLPAAGGALNVYVRALQALAAPGSAGGAVVALPDRPAPAETPEAVPALTAVGAGTGTAPSGEAPADGVLADFRGVAPAVQSFAAGRRR
jgi:error-prone DNA polymerase